MGKGYGEKYGYVRGRGVRGYVRGRGCGEGWEGVMEKNNVGIRWGRVSGKGGEGLCQGQGVKGLWRRVGKGYVRGRGYREGGYVKIRKGVMSGAGVMGKDGKGL